MFSVTSGVCQGCVLARTLFNFYNAIHMTLDVHRQEERGIKAAYLLDADLMGNRLILKLGTLVTDLEYADNMVLLANNWVDLTTILDSLATTCKKLGLTISCKCIFVFHLSRPFYLPEVFMACDRWVYGS